MTLILTEVMLIAHRKEMLRRKIYPHLCVRYCPSDSLKFKAKNFLFNNVYLDAKRFERKDNPVNLCYTNRTVSIAGMRSEVCNIR